MSFYIDTKYLNVISGKLPLFAKKRGDLWNCRCIVCGDSKTNQRKARGYFYRQRNDLFYKCHNCLVSQHFGTFLKSFDPSLYKQYVLERYANGEHRRKAHANVDEMFAMAPPVFKKDPLRQIAQPLTEVGPDNEAYQYCVKRQIPVEKFDRLYYIPSVKDIAKLDEKYHSMELTEPRLLLPFYDETGRLTGGTMRGLRGEALRYVSFTLVPNAVQIFGMPQVEVTRTIYVVEGPIDSLFLPNAIAVSGTSFGKLELLDLPKERVVVVMDNQPRNKEVCAMMEKYLRMGYTMCIWPPQQEEKDINELVVRGHDPLQLIESRTYSGLMASLKFSEWRKC